MQLKSVSSSSMLSGIMYMLLAMFALATMDALAKHLVQDRFDPIQILAMRGWIILLLMLVFYASRSKLRKLKPVKPMHQLARGVFGFLAPYCFFKSLQVLPLADATVIFFSSTFMITAFIRAIFEGKGRDLSLVSCHHGIHWRYYRNGPTRWGRNRELPLLPSG